ncbi:MAG: hypothetical protein ACLRZG_05410 [Streptococcus sp.]
MPFMHSESLTIHERSPAPI